MSEPLLSIVTITYKDPDGLGATIGSLRELLGSAIRWEHVIVDSSPEENASVLASVRNTSWPLCHVTVPAEGIYAALNQGLRAASGELLWFLNGGDLLRSVTALKKTIQAFIDDPSTDLVANAVELQRDGAFLYFHRPAAFISHSLIGTNRLCHQGVTYRRRAFEVVGEFSTRLKLAADYEHHWKCLAAGLKVQALPENVLAVYDMSGRSTDFKLAFEEFKTVQRELRLRLPLHLSAGNELLRPLEYMRVALLKSIASSPAAGLLKPVWLAFKRRR